MEGEENFSLVDEFENFFSKVKVDTLKNHIQAWSFLEGYEVFIPE